MTPGAVIVRGPFPVNYSDIPNNGDALTLFTPVVGSVMVAFTGSDTIEAWDEGTYIGLGQNLDVSVINGQWDYVDPTDVANLREFGMGSNFRLGSTLLGVEGKSWVVTSDDPVTVAFGDSAVTPTPPSQGHIDLYFRIAVPVAP